VAVFAFREPLPPRDTSRFRRPPLLLDFRDAAALRVDWC